jgi:K+-transporting ATPase KdpF subunit
MNELYLVTGVLTAGLLAYLFVAMLMPERF